MDSENWLQGADSGSIWDENGWPDRPPTYDELIKLNLLPIVIFDVAVQSKGSIMHAFEVVHRHGISETKLAYLKRIDIPTYSIDADWILSRSERPEELVCDLVT